MNLPSVFRVVGHNERRQDESRWMFTDYPSPEELLTLVTQDCTRPLRELYERVTL